MPDAEKRKYNRAYYLKNRDKFLSERAAYFSENRELVLAKNKAYFEANKVSVHASQAKYREKNADALRAKNREWHHDNIAHVKAYRHNNADRIQKRSADWWKKNREDCLKKNAAWYKNNPEKANALKAKYRADKKTACPVWADLDAIQAVFLEAKRLQAETGIKYCVDHIVPLTHKLVCGLHIAANLRAITFEENAKKKNKLIQELACQLPQLQTSLD